MITVLPLLLRFWKPLAGALAILVILFVAYRWAHERGYRTAEMHYRPLLYAAQIAKAQADERAVTLERAAESLTAEYEARYADQQDALATHAADAERRIRAISVRLAAAGARCREVPAHAGAAGSADAAAESERRAAEAGGRIADVGRDCESDAAGLAALQSWLRDQLALRVD